MTTLTWDTFTPERRSWWSYVMEFLGAQPVRTVLRRQETPAYEQKFGDVDVRERSTETLPEPDYKPTKIEFDDPPTEEPPPAPAPVQSFKYDPVVDLKRQLRALNYGDFIAAAEGMGCAPKKLWAWAISE